MSFDACMARTDRDTQTNAAGAGKDFVRSFSRSRSRSLSASGMWWEVGVGLKFGCVLMLGACCCSNDTYMKPEGLGAAHAAARSKYSNTLQA